MDADLAVEKLRKVVAAHSPFFETLGRFARQPGRRMTFMTGNHDIELCFAVVRVGIVEAMGVRQDDGRVYFCPTRSYRPFGEKSSSREHLVDMHLLQWWFLDVYP
jgi:hypothetical protein